MNVSIPAMRGKRRSRAKPLFKLPDSHCFGCGLGRLVSYHLHRLDRSLIQQLGVKIAALRLRDFNDGSKSIEQPLIPWRLS